MNENYQNIKNSYPSSNNLYQYTSNPYNKGDERLAGGFVLSFHFY